MTIITELLKNIAQVETESSYTSTGKAAISIIVNGDEIRIARYY